MNRRQYINTGIISLVVFFALTPLGGYGGHPYKFLAAALVYCALTYFFLRRATTTKERWWTILLIALPPALFMIPTHIMDFEEYRFSFPSSMAHFIGILFGYLVFVTSRQLKIILVTILVTGSAWMTFKGYSIWLHKASFGTYSGNVQERVPAFVLKNSSGSDFTNAQLASSITILDFWNTACAACFRKFPLLQQKFDNYKADTSIKIFSVNIPLERDTAGQAENTLKKYNYTFSNLLAQSKSVADSFHVNSVPTTLIIDQRGIIVYRGDIDNIDEVITKLKTN